MRFITHHDRMLDNVVIQEGDFTEDFFHKNDWWRDLPEVSGTSTPVDYEQALLEAEGDEMDAEAAKMARKEMNMDEEDFEEQKTASEDFRAVTPNEEEEDMQLEVGHVDQYMLRFWEREMFGVNLGFGGFLSDET